jgi:hypothetical protein
MLLVFDVFGFSTKIKPLQVQPHHAAVNSTTATASTVTRNLSPLSTRLTNILKSNGSIVSSVNFRSIYSHLKMVVLPKHVTNKE